MPESNIQYKGRVAIKVKNKPSVRAHNEGTYHLFNLVNRIFSKALVDLTDISQRLPAYITLIAADGKVTNEALRTNPDYSAYSQYSILIKELPIISKEIIDDTIKYASLLTTTVIDGSALNAADKGYALLLDSSCKDILAFSYVDLKMIEAMQETQLGQSEIEWSMSFSNSLEEDN